MPNGFIPWESSPGETQGAATRGMVKLLLMSGLIASIEGGAGASALMSDDQVTAAGASARR